MRVQRGGVSDSGHGWALETCLSEAEGSREQDAIARNDAMAPLT